MNLIQTIGFLPNCYRSWFTQQSGMKHMPTSKIAGRRFHKWFGFEVILTNPATINLGYRDDRVIELGDALLPGWNCALLCHYHPGGHMTRHCDHSVFEPMLVSVNIGRATLCIGNQEYYLEDGQVISFDSKIPHELRPVVSDRWSLIFRRIKFEYLPV